jgi:uncharacterized protein YnzC (UPF0291/DUF896 family)
MWGIKIVKRYLLSMADFDFTQHRSLSPKAVGGLLVLLVTMLSGCGTTGKMSDCEAFVKTNRQVDAYFAKNALDGAVLGKKKFNGVAEQKKLAKEYLTFFLQSVETSNKAITAIQGMSLKDDQLQTLQSEYLSITKKTKEAIDRLAVISAEQNTSAITDAIVKDPKLDVKLVAKSKQLDDDFQEKVKILGVLGTEEGKVIDKVNAYCGQPTSGSTGSPTNSPSSSPTNK